MIPNKPAGDHQNFSGRELRRAICWFFVAAVSVGLVVLGWLWLLSHLTSSQ
jgi:hypothetical protein